MTSVALALIIPGTFLLGINDVLIRKTLRNGKINQQVLLAIDLAGSAVLLSIPLFFMGIIDIKPGFWSAILVTVVMNILAQWAWFNAFRREEASLISPLRLITLPVIILTGLIILGERVSLLGMLGIGVIMVGLWFLTYSEAAFKNKTLIEVLRRPGILFGILGAISFAISAPFDKKAVLTSSPLMVVVLAFGAIGIAHLFIGLCISCHDGKILWKGVWEEWRSALAIPILHGTAAFLVFTALTHTLVAYVISVKRLWSLWAVILSGSFLKESNIRAKLGGTAIILFGIAIIVLWE